MKGEGRNNRLFTKTTGNRKDSEDSTGRMEGDTVLSAAQKKPRRALGGPAEQEICVLILFKGGQRDFREKLRSAKT